MSPVTDIEHRVEILSGPASPELQKAIVEELTGEPSDFAIKPLAGLTPDQIDITNHSDIPPLTPPESASELEAADESTAKEIKPGFFSSRVKRAGVMAGALLVATVLGNGGLAKADTAKALVRGAISENPNGISTITPPGSRRLELQNVDSLSDVLRKLRLSYLQNCTYSMSQNQFGVALRDLATSSNENARIINSAERIRSGKMFLWQRVMKGLKKDSTFSLDIPRCRRPAWEAYVNIGLSHGETFDEEVEEARIKSGCQRVTPKFYKDQVWYMNPVHQDDGDVINFSWNVLPGPFEVPITVPICARVNKFNPSDTPGPYAGWIRSGRPVEPNNNYMTD